MMRKKHLISIIAISIAIFFASFTITKPKYSIAYFVYNLGDLPSESQFENLSNWTFFSSQPGSCDPGPSTCSVNIATSVYSGYSGSTEVQRFVNFLIAQNGEAGEWSSSAAAVNAMSNSKESD